MLKLLSKMMLYNILFVLGWSFLCLSLFKLGTLSFDVALYGGCVAFGFYGGHYFSPQFRALVRKGSDEKGKK